ncbi:MarR family transcriptional regulator [uncultured Polaribacter sp.]|uniref:MarR family winged helix-turn-helix transcriptional regulator n=1 Tax=uncultured Polaribacter sp. TaxID=174711 RepID=UPI00263094B4|nr:MarR family transcriptional regulator [uncultured Polaribacter sp.]
MGKEILREIGKIYRALNSFSDFLMKSINLEKGQYQFLLRVKENPGINQQDLSLNLLVDKTTTAKAIKKLVGKGYVIKKVSQTDKRNINLYLTEKGKKTCILLDQEEQFATKISLREITTSEQKILLKQLDVIGDNVTQLYSNFKNDNEEHFIKLVKKEKI